MIIYNVTVQVNHSIHEEWITWLRSTHIPQVIATGCFASSRILRLLETDETDGPTYAIQYHAANTSDYERYIAIHANTLRQDGIDKWGDQFIAFRTIMSVIE